MCVVSNFLLPHNEHMLIPPHMPSQDSLDKKGNNPVLESIVAMLGHTVRMDKFKKC
jgi:hypothetical protein